MTPCPTAPDPRPGERWIGGTNGGHPFGLAEVVTVTQHRVRVRFLGGPNHGKLRWLYRYQFVVQFQPDRST